MWATAGRLGLPNSHSVSRGSTDFEIFQRGSRQLKLFWASLTLQGPECVDPTFSRWRIKRRGQREKVASSDRLPGFRIRACSALVRFEIERSGISFLLPLLFEEGLPFFIPSRSRVLCRGKEFFPKFQEGSILQPKTFPGEITGFSRRTSYQRFSTSAPTGPWKRELGIVLNLLSDR